MNTARIAAMAAGFPKEVAGTTVNRFCSSGSQAVMMAAHSIINEGADVALGAGVETITMMQDGSQNTTRLANAAAQARFPGLYFPMGLTAEIVAERYGISREEPGCDLAHKPAALRRSRRSGTYREEITPMKVTRKVMKKGEDPYDEDFTVELDECNRPQTTLEGLNSLKPVFKPAEEGGTVTAGNASQLSTAPPPPCSCPPIGQKNSASNRWASTAEPLSRLRPRRDGHWSRLCVPKLLKRHGLTIDDIDIVEINEAFASQLLYCQRELGIPSEKLNPSGGSISIGHPFGMTGSRMTGVLLRQLKRQGKRYGIVTMCIGGGQGLGFTLRVRLIRPHLSEPPALPIRRGWCASTSRKGFDLRPGFFSPAPEHFHNWSRKPIGDGLLIGRKRIDPGVPRRHSRPRLDDGRHGQVIQTQYVRQQRGIRETKRPAGEPNPPSPARLPYHQEDPTSSSGPPQTPEP